MNRGWEIRPAVVDRERVDAVLRTLNLDMLRHGWDAPTLSDWLWSAHWFPHLKWGPAVVALADALPDEWCTGERCDPQIVLQFPHSGPLPAITTHVDQSPTWAHGRRYRRVVGVPLTRWTRRNGGLLLEELDGSLFAPELEPGDAVLLGPDQPHTPGVNVTGEIRYGVYYRWLEWD
jgi:hypothetical protein